MGGDKKEERSGAENGGRRRRRKKVFWQSWTCCSGSLGRRRFSKYNFLFRSPPSEQARVFATNVVSDSAVIVIVAVKLQQTRERERRAPLTLGGYTNTLQGGQKWEIFPPYVDGSDIRRGAPCTHVLYTTYKRYLFPLRAVIHTRELTLSLPPSLGGGGGDDIITSFAS